MARTFVWHPSKGPGTTSSMKIKDGEKVRIKQVRSGIGHAARMRATLAAMGIRNHQAVIEREMTPALRGQIKQVRHLVEVVTAGAQAETNAKRSSSNKAASKSSTSKKSKTEK
jgi:large subunit ribosomal protein L30